MAAVDIGAESGRTIVGAFDGEELKVAEVHRFPNHPVKASGTLHWDVLRIFGDMLNGLRAVGRVASVGIDTWGVDFGLIDTRGRLIANPTHYRDRRTEGTIDEAYRLITREEIYAHTGIQFMSINTLYQLLSMALTEDPQLGLADRLLMMPALLNYWLTGVKADEYTDATTTQCFDVSGGRWAFELLQRLGIPGRLFGDVVAPGTDLGPPLADLGLDLGRIIAPGTHDTASAVAAVPLVSGGHGAYISSGTWGLVGIETKEPIINGGAMKANVSNEGGVEGTFRVLKNVMGLWLLQECRRAWAKGGANLSYEELLDLAHAAPPFAAVIDPDDQRLLRPGDMPARIAELAAESGNTVLEGAGPIARCILESLALKYRTTIALLDKIAPSKIQTIHVVGGGARNQLLCQLTANACGCEVIAGPVEATAIGNLLVQAIACGQIANLEQGRELVRRSFELKTYEPQMASEWNRFGEVA
jgi:rhamnulokinase